MAETRINLGGGRKNIDGYLNIDITQFFDGNGKKCVDIVMDVEHEKLPYNDASVDEILADNVLEHLHELRFTLNECHRVLKEGGVLRGCVPIANTIPALKDPTHVRVFIKETFSYFTGVNPAKPDRPAHPKYADYGYLPWIENDLKEEDNLIYFNLSPRKI